MILIEIADLEYFNEETSEFVMIKGQKLALEHSLVSISKWESRWKVPFVVDKIQEEMHPEYKKTFEMRIDYIRCMTLTQNVKHEIYYALTAKQIEDIYAYINDEHSATPTANSWNRNNDKAKSIRKDPITSELVYYWMIAYNIPQEYQKWHFNRLLILIEICSRFNSAADGKSKGMSAEEQRALNEARRARSRARR